ncbi:unnamed protein product [Cuscuta campestris]|uniref:Transposase (putative) gypsy type domain-containing protein n=1 Tax=Cuscuta campestris TaxID=132261 RepID=A0A484MDV4_9ASTE|nr:unnamed protein product [Cuscuta campestris]
MRIYIRSTNFQLWLVIKNGEEIPMKKVGETTVPKTENEFDAEDIKKVENYEKAINMLYCAVNPDDYRKISCCSTAKEMWDKLEVTYEGTDQVREAKIDFLTQEYEMFRMKEHENIDDMFDRFSKIVNDLHTLKKTYTDRDLVRKILRSLTSEWRSKADAIYESIGTSNVTIDGLRGNLKMYESTILNPSLNDQRKGIALKASKESTMNDSSDDDEVKLVMKKFCKLLRNKEKTKPVDASTCAPSSSAAQVVTVARSMNKGFIPLDDRLLLEELSYMQKAQIHELRNLMPYGYQLSFRATWKNIISLHTGTTIAIPYHSIKELGEFSIHPFKILFLETYGVMPGQLAPNGQRMLSSFINVCRFLRIPLSLRLFNHMETDDLASWEATLRTGDTSTRGPYNVGKWGVYPGPETDRELEIVLGEVIPDAIPLRRVQGSKAPVSATTGSSRRGKKKKKGRPTSGGRKRKRWRTQAVDQCAESFDAGKGQGGPRSLALMARSDEELFQAFCADLNEVGRIDQEWFTQLVKSKDEEKAWLEGMMVACQKEAKGAHQKVEKTEEKLLEHSAAFRKLYAKHEGLLNVSKDTDAQAQEKIQELEGEKAQLKEEAAQLTEEAARSAQEITHLKAELEREGSERATYAAALAAQEPDQFAAWVIPNREVSIRFFQGLYKHEKSAKVIDEIGTFGYESGQYQERRALYGILQRRIQGFEPKAFSLPELHNEELVATFEGI